MNNKSWLFFVQGSKSGKLCIIGVFFSLTKTAFEMSRDEIAMGIIWNILTGVCYISKWQQEVKHCSDGLNWKVSALVVFVLFCYVLFFFFLTSHDFQLLV